MTNNKAKSQKRNDIFITLLRFGSFLNIVDGVFAFVYNASVGFIPEFRGTSKRLQQHSAHQFCKKK